MPDGSPQRRARRAEAERIASQIGEVEPAELTKVGPNGLRHLIESKQQVLQDPRGVLEELQKAMARAIALQELLEQKVAELKAEEWQNLSVFGQVQPRLQLYERSIERVQRMLGDYIRLEVEVRKIALEESQAALIADLLRRIFDDPTLGLDSEQRKQARLVAAKQLRLVDGAA